jgi:signal transduction histidine kinase
MILNLRTANEEIRVKQEKLELLYLELIDSNSELKKANDELKITQKKLVQSEKMASLGSLVTGIAHEINTPMGVSILANSLLIEKADSINQVILENKLRKSDINEFINSVYECNDIIHRNLEKISDLLKSFKQISVNNMYSDRRVFNIEKCIKDIIFSLKAKLQNINVTLECEKSLKIDSYLNAYSIIFNNLLINTAVHAYNSGEEGAVHIKIFKDEYKLTILYTDYGVGMDETTRSKIFDPFFTTKRSKGVGLGMNIVFNTVTSKLNGDIKCTSSPKEGTTFKIVIPIEIEKEEVSGTALETGKT